MRFKNTLLGNAIKDYFKGFIIMALFSPVLLITAFLLGLLAAAMCWAAVTGWNIISPF